ncbi:TetR/AcrR family transcriptional regulator [Cumulibacter manganitolerans]|uniref:TetR/AcrR family transcriptional regulator n=1 Tax=Cumulibacter manganitolerans TaxID=1884992 RepID=UPI00129798BD|nr:TetR/AcrR family transcriptional regulator [Cumulibacter manganitolerans]
MQTPQDDLTAKARIRNVALELFATSGLAGAPLRAIADRAGVTVGLITHHFGSKDGLRVAVDQYVVDTYRHALEAIPLDTPGLAAERDRSVAQMLRAEPAIAAYLRRAYLDPIDGGVLDRLTDLTLEEVRRLRARKLASVARTEQVQATHVIVRQLGDLLLQPLADRVWRRLTGQDEAAPRVSTGIGAASGS